MNLGRLEQTDADIPQKLEKHPAAHAARRRNARATEEAWHWGDAVPGTFEQGWKFVSNHVRGSMRIEITVSEPAFPA